MQRRGMFADVVLAKAHGLRTIHLQDNIYFRTRAGCLKSIKLQARSLFVDVKFPHTGWSLKCQRALVCGLLFDTKGVELAVIRQVVQILGMNTGRFCRVNRLSCGSGCAKLQDSGGALCWVLIAGESSCLTKLI